LFERIAWSVKFRVPAPIRVPGGVDRSGGRIWGENRVVGSRVVKFLPLASDQVMGRTKAIDEADLQEVLSLRDDFGVLQKDSAQMQNQVSKL
jgi:hypothetical protein